MHLARTHGFARGGWIVENQAVGVVKVEQGIAISSRVGRNWWIST